MGAMETVVLPVADLPEGDGVMSIDLTRMSADARDAFANSRAFLDDHRLGMSFARRGPATRRAADARHADLALQNAIGWASRCQLTPAEEAAQ